MARWSGAGPHATGGAPGGARAPHPPGTGELVAGENVDPARITRLPTEIDVASRGAAEADLLAAVSVPGLVIADMTGTAICDSAGMRMLLAAHDRARSTGASLRVAVTPGTSVARVMAILGVNRILSLYDSVEDAQAACAARRLQLARKPRRPLGPKLCTGLQHGRVTAYRCAPAVS